MLTEAAADHKGLQKGHQMLSKLLWNYLFKYRYFRNSLNPKSFTFGNITESEIR